MNAKNTSEQFVIGNETNIYLPDGEDKPTGIAADILAADIERIVGTKPKIISGIPPSDADGPFILISSADNPNSAQLLSTHDIPTDKLTGQWEAYLFRSVPGGLVICGADALATMRGVYRFSRIKLGVDPLIRWTGIEPTGKDQVDLGIIDEVIPSPTFKFRGWFLNAGKLIRWNLGKGPVYDVIARFKGMVDAGISGAFGPEMTRMIAETALRLDINTIIPLSCLDIDDPDEKRVADICAEHGLFLSFHHCEPVGANLRDWSKFWKTRGEQIPEMSFHKHPDKFETWWKYYIEQWARYPRVVWTLGHRGPGDRQFWIADKSCPDTDDAHGKVISDAMEMQLRLIRNALGDSEIHYCATLWADGSSLHAAGKLQFPPGTMVLMADHGGKQMMREDFYSTPRREDLTYGVYYHVCYSPGGPIHTQGASVDKMWYNLRQLVERGETEIALLNVGPIRPYFPTLAAFSEITTTGEIEPEDFLLDWCTREYGGEHAEEIVECYNMYFEAFVDPFYRGYDGLRGFWDGVLATESASILRMIWSGDVEEGYRKKRHVFPSARAFLSFQRNKIAAMRGSWDALCTRAHEISDKIEGPPQDLFEDNMVVQSELNRALCGGAYHIARAASCFMSTDTDAAIEQLRQAHEVLSVGWDYCLKNGNRGIYTDWYLDSPDRGINQKLLVRIDRLMEKLEGKEPSSAQETQYLEKLFQTGHA